MEELSLAITLLPRYTDIKVAKREKRLGQTVRLDRDMWLKLAHLAIDLRRTQHALIVEGIRLVLDKYDEQAKGGS